MGGKAPARPTVAFKKPKHEEPGHRAGGHLRDVLPRPRLSGHRAGGGRRGLGGGPPQQGPAAEHRAEGSGDRHRAAAAGAPVPGRGAVAARAAGDDGACRPPWTRRCSCVARRSRGRGGSTRWWRSRATAGAFDARVVDEKGRVYVELLGYRTVALPGRGRRSSARRRGNAPKLQPGRDRQPRGGRSPLHPRRSGAEPRGRAAPHHRALHRRPTGTPCSCGRPTRPTPSGPALVEGARRPADASPTWTSRSWSGRWWRPVRRRPGPAGASWPRMPDFVELCDRLGVTFIGPSAGAMRGLADKIASKRLAEGLGIPVVPWSGAPRRTRTRRRVRPADLGFPVMVKASAGGGGRGIREADDARRRSRRLRGGPHRGRKGLRAGDGVPRAAARRRPPRRHPGGERRLGRSVGAAGSRLRRCSGGTRRCWRSARPRVCPPPRRRSCARPPPASCAPRATWARRRWSSCTTRRAGTTGSWRPTRASRWSTRSPRSPPASTSSSCRCTSPGAAVSRSRSRHRPATPSRCGSAPRTRRPASPPRPGPVARLRLPGGPGLRVDAGVAEGDTSPPSSTR